MITTTNACLKKCICFAVIAVTGHQMVLTSTDTRSGFSARLQTSYFNTSGRCTELYFQSTTLPNALDTSKVSIILVSEEKDESVLVSSSGLESSALWNRMFAVLPDGVHQVVIEGRRSLTGFSSLSVDDIIIQPCIKFGQFSWS
jgi:MAM domain, meprin/A5/mu